MEIVRQEIALLVREALEHERDHGDLAARADLAIYLPELFRVGGAIVGRQAYAHEKRARPALAARVDDAFEVGAHLFEIATAQAVVGAQGENDDVGTVLLQGGRDPVSSPGGGLAADARVDYFIIETFFAQAACEQACPFLAGRQSVAGGETVPEHQDRRGRRDSGPQGERAGGSKTECDAEQS